MINFQHVGSVNQFVVKPPNYNGYRGKVVSVDLNKIVIHPEEAFVWSWSERPQVVSGNCYAFVAAKPFFTKGLISKLKASEKTGVITLCIQVPAPGTTGGKCYKSMTRGALQDAFIRDGFEPVRYGANGLVQEPDEGYLMAAFLRPVRYETVLREDGSVRRRYLRGDYHVLRYFPETKSWGHKRGWQNKPHDYDDKGRVIRKVEDAIFDGYTQFVGIYRSPPGRMPVNVVIQTLDGEVVAGLLDRPRKPKIYSVKTSLFMPPSLGAA